MIMQRGALSLPIHFHRGIVLATARRLVAPGSMKQGFLCRRHVSLFASPDLQGRLLEGAAERKRQRPGPSRLESNVHGIQAGRGQFSGLAARQERNPRNGRGDGSQETPHRGVGHLVHRFLLGSRSIPEAPCWA